MRNPAGAVNVARLHAREPEDFSLKPTGTAGCSFGRIWLISHGLSGNEQYFSLIPNQPTVLSVMAYKPNQPKRTGRKGTLGFAACFA